MGSSSPIFGVQNPKPLPSYVMHHQKPMKLWSCAVYFFPPKKNSGIQWMDPCFSLMYMESNLQKKLGFYNTLWKINVEHKKK